MPSNVDGRPDLPAPAGPTVLTTPTAPSVSNAPAGSAVTISSVVELREYLARKRATATTDTAATTAAPAATTAATVGFVATMGFLHEGHASLIRAAAKDCDIVVVSIFVNPLQFGEGEDLDAYPRDLERDLIVAGASGADVVFIPSVSELYPGYPNELDVRVVAGSLSKAMEGACRPTHFDGVVTVVAKLFNIVGPCRAYFGEKDFQQLMIVSKMVADLSFPVDVVAMPIVREANGLALSSRNKYLSAEEFDAAAVLFRGLSEAAAAVAGGECDRVALCARLRDTISAEPLVSEPDYVEIVNSATLEPAGELLSGELRILVAAQVGKARLIDNIAASAIC